MAVAYKGDSWAPPRACSWRLCRAYRLSVWFYLRVRLFFLFFFHRRAGDGSRGKSLQCRGGASIELWFRERELFLCVG